MQPVLSANKLLRVSWNANEPNALLIQAILLNTTFIGKQATRLQNKFEIWKLNMTQKTDLYVIRKIFPVKLSIKQSICWRKLFIFVTVLTLRKSKFYTSVKRLTGQAEHHHWNICRMQAVSQNWPNVHSIHEQVLNWHCCQHKPLPFQQLPFVGIFPPHTKTDCTWL